MYSSVSAILNDDQFLQIGGFEQDLYLKLESLNPAGSIKMKTARGLIEDAEAHHPFNRDTVLIESSSGNLGVAAATICAERGIRFTCVIDPNCSRQNEATIRSLGAKVVKVTERDENGGFLGTRIGYIRRKLAEDPNHIWLNQYENPANPRVHARLTARAIADAFPRVDYLFVGAGTTGTLMGCLQYFAAHRPETRVIAVDSIGSITFGLPASARYIPGLGTSHLPPIFDPSGLFAAELVPEAQTVVMCRHLARSRGILAGGSTGTVLAGYHAWRHRIPRGATVVAISPDWGDRYLDSVYDDDWVTQRFGASVLSAGPEDMQDWPSLTLPLSPEADPAVAPHRPDTEVVGNLLRLR